MIAKKCSQLYICDILIEIDFGDLPKRNHPPTRQPSKGKSTSFVHLTSEKCILPLHALNRQDHSYIFALGRSKKCFERRV